MSEGLPRPVTQQDVYLHDIATSLRAMTGRNVYQLDDTYADGTVELREPAVQICGETTQSGTPCRNSRPCRWHEAA